MPNGSRTEELLRRAVVILPAYNEAAAIGGVIADVRRHVPDAAVLVVNDRSMDRTADAARAAGAVVLDLPCNLGVGGAMQAGFRYALDRGFEVAIRCDADGQHPPEEIPKLAAAMLETGADLVIGSRFLGEHSYRSTALRSAGIHALAALLSRICRARVTDPTSGFQMLNRPLLRCFAQAYPSDYPEPESLALMRRQGYVFTEAPVRFCARSHGVSSIDSWGTLYYALKVFLALAVDRARTVDARLAKSRILAGEAS